MAMKCVHKGCGKKFTDENEDCIYHPGPPEFHEGQKGWKCCKPRVLTFDEFLAIPPCTTGKHSTIDETPLPDSKPAPAPDAAPVPTVKPISTSTSNASTSAPNGAAATQPKPPSAPPAQPPPPESDSDDPATTIPDGVTCKRRGCGATSPAPTSGDKASCVYHPGVALFHEGAKGWTCCKRRVLEFDEFMRIPGCKTRGTHCFVGKKTRRKRGEDEGADGDFEKVDHVRHDFYQTGSVVHATYFLKKIDKAASRVEFQRDGRGVELDLKTADGKRYEAVVPLYGKIVPGESSFRVLGTKLDLSLKKKEEATGWPVLRSDERTTGEIIQTGVAGRA